MARKVTVFLRGGLGNQMFQYAAGFDLAKRSNAQLVLDTTFLNDRFPRKEFTFRTYDLDILGIDTDFTVLSKISGAIPIPGLWLGLDLALAKIKNFLGVQKIIKEPSVTSAGISATQGSVLLFGYWQNEKYFSGTKDDLRTIFNVSIPLEGAAEEIAEKMRNTNSVAVFVRRGDYVKFASVRAQMGDTSVAYYQSAAAYIAEHVDHPTFFVFSDDIEWCEENLKIPFSTTYVPNTQEMIVPIGSSIWRSANTVSSRTARFPGGPHGSVKIPKKSLSRRKNGMLPSLKRETRRFLNG